MPASKGARRCIEDTFAKIERQGLTTALWIRLAALVVIQIWLLLVVHERYTLFYHGWLTIFLVIGATQLFMIYRDIGPQGLAYLFAALDGVLIAVALLVTNPFLTEMPPPAMILRYANIIVVFVFLAGAAFSYNSGLVLCTGLSTVVVWRIGVWMLSTRPSAITSSDQVWIEADGMTSAIELFLNPEFIHLPMQDKKVLMVFIVTILLSAVVRRARALVQNQVVIERARTNLARHFSPNLVDELAEQDQPFGAVRRQSVAVLFADMQGFTRMSETMPPEAVVDLLRCFHEHLERAVFAHDGTLDKYIGDGLMATFGTPTPGERDATNALLAARRMLKELEALNAERVSRGDPALAVSIGIHYGPVVLGDIGGAHRLEFTVLGDTVNVASRLEEMTRELETPLAVSREAIDQIALETDDPDLEGLVEIEAQPIRGRTGRLNVWMLKQDRQAIVA